MGGNSVARALVFIFYGWGLSGQPPCPCRSVMALPTSHPTRLYVTCCLNKAWGEAQRNMKQCLLCGSGSWGPQRPAQSVPWLCRVGGPRRCSWGRRQHTVLPSPPGAPGATAASSQGQPFRLQGTSQCAHGHHVTSVREMVCSHPDGAWACTCAQSLPF